MIMIRYADDLVVASSMKTMLGASGRDARKAAEFSLSLHPDKTRLIEFGRLRCSTARSAGFANRRPSSPGFVLICGKSRRAISKSKGSRAATACVRGSGNQGSVATTNALAIPEREMARANRRRYFAYHACRPMARRLLHFATTSSSSGIGGCAGAAREHAWYGRRWRAGR